jgi:hypothetical protein
MTAADRAALFLPGIFIAAVIGCVVRWRFTGRCGLETGVDFVSGAIALVGALYLHEWLS